MTTTPLAFDEPVLLVGGGALDRATLDAAMRHARIVIAADGGADHLLALGAAPPHAIIGDMDSIGPAKRWIDDPAVAYLHLPEQETTDLEKCLYSVSAPLFLGVGFFGERIDHTLAALHVALRRPGKRLLFVGSHDLCFPAPRLWRSDLPAGARVSIWPGMPVRGLASTGLRWPIEGLDLAVGAQIGTSNEAVGGAVEARFDRLGAVIMLETERLDSAIDSILLADREGHFA